MINDFLEKYGRYIDKYTSHISEIQEANDVIDDFMLCGVQSVGPVVIYGAGCVGRNLVRLFKELKIKVDLVVDKNYQQIEDCFGKEVTDPKYISSIEGKVIIIYACDRLIEEDMKNDVRTIGIVPFEEVCGNNLNILVQSAWCMQKAYNRDISSINDCYECPVLDNTCNSLCKFYKIRGNHDESKETGTASVNMIGYLLSNICTLRCKNCCESVPYMPQDTKHFVKAEQVISDITKMAKAVKYLTLVEFIGGEPFLHPELVRIIDKIKAINNVGMLHIFTNGTVVPSNELCEVLKDNRITVYMSNYQVSYPDVFMEKVKETADKLTKFGIQFYFGKKTNWSDFHCYDECCSEHEKLVDKYPQCFLHNCNRLMDGKLYVCPHQYAGIQLGKLKDVNTLNIYDYDDEELAKQLDIFKDFKYIDACKYCTMPFDAPTVPSGEQL